MPSRSLSEALQRNAPDAEINKLMQELREAMEEYMKELAQRMQNAPSQPNQQNAQDVCASRICEKMMDQIENLARSGNRDAAQQMLSEMQRMMNNLQAGRPAAGQQQQGKETARCASRWTSSARSCSEQQKLMDETFKLDQALRDRMQRGDPNEETDPLPSRCRPAGPTASGTAAAAAGPATSRTAAGPRPAEAAVAGRRHDGRPAARGAEGAARSSRTRWQSSSANCRRASASMGMKPGQGFGQAEREMKGAGGALGKGDGEQAVAGPGPCAAGAAPGRPRHDATR